jgi:hypothetical protein
VRSVLCALVCGYKRKERRKEWREGRRKEGRKGGRKERREGEINEECNRRKGKFRP